MALIGLAVAYFVFCLAVLVTRYVLLPHIGEWTPRIEQIASHALRSPVHIDHIDGNWQGLNPRLELHQVSVEDGHGGEALSLKQVEVVVSWTSLLRGKPIARALNIDSPELAIRRRRDHLIDIAGFTVDPNANRDDSPFLDWLLTQGSVRIQHATVHLTDDMPATGPVVYDLDQVNFLLTRQLTGHRFSLQATPPADLTSSIDLRGRFTHPWLTSSTEISQWKGTLFLQVDQADLARLQSIAHLLDTDVTLQQAHGNTRVWLDFSQGHIDHLEADLALNGLNARWRPDLDPMKLDHLEGRVSLTRETHFGTENQSLTLSHLSLDGPDGLHLSPSNLSWSNQGNMQVFMADSLRLAEWGRLARMVPLPADWINQVEQARAHGSLENISASWDDRQTPPVAYTFRGDFADLGFALAGTTAGQLAGSQFDHLSGHLDLDQTQGSLKLNGSNADLRLLPIWGANTLHFSTLETQLRWQQAAGSGAVNTQLTIDSVGLANPDLDLHGHGTLRWTATQRIPTVDLSGAITRARVNRVITYLPVTLPADTLSWLRGGLVDGQAGNGNFTLKGDLTRFPFTRPEDGTFAVNLDVRGGEIDPAPLPAGSKELPWPHLRDIDARLRFDRDTMIIEASRAHAFAYELFGIRVQIPHLDSETPHLLVNGQGNGQLADLLRYAGNSPVNAWTGSWLKDARGSGSAKLSLKLDLPLAHIDDSLVNGQIGLRDNTLIPLPDLPPFANTSGNLFFSEKGIHFDRLSTGFLGGTASISADTRPDGTVTFTGSGTATPSGVRPLLPAGTVRRLTDSLRGQTRYQAAVSLHGDDLSLQVDSDLTGISSTLPAPLAKAGSDPRPLRVDITPEPGKSGRSTVRVRWAKDLDVAIQRQADAAGNSVTTRGVVALGQTAQPTEPGLVVLVDQPALDLDRWFDLLFPVNDQPDVTARSLATVHQTTDTTDALLKRVVIRSRTLTLGRRHFSNVMLNARHQTTGSWQAQIDADEAAGTAIWDGSVASHGRLTARLAQLRLQDIADTRGPNQGSSLSRPRDYPDLDITADQFSLGKQSLGHLELLAHASGTPGDHAWDLQKLRLANSDGNINATGSWRVEPATANRRVTLDTTVDANNFGNLMDRMGWRGYVRNGQGQLTAHLSWLGEPASPDLATLSGKVHLDARNGVITRLDAGAGRLLAIFSFQSFWKLITGDLREFSSGVAFDSVSDDAAINQGVLKTENFLMKGNAGAGRIQGRLDLQHQTQDLDVVVIPQVSASGASLAYAAFVNPAIGLSALVGNLLLNKPLEALLTKHYHVAGSWADPHIESGSRTPDNPAPAP
jgi:uncharacterized protein (TIGR02099 family)